ncbi:hypothetical protein PROSTU_04687 [Providencia stuartii ATCC 25827]|uniref:Uncharacterized protein n=1 Tax=Providencia stuartii ATCC 25827 TaxID=471874 RepID=A0AA86YV90_PROST|nr:hypothetical protein PROSTU_04687 [Providencia stuartii ATCC 25827]
MILIRLFKLINDAAVISILNANGKRTDYIQIIIRIIVKLATKKKTDNP